MQLFILILRCEEIRMVFLKDIIYQHFTRRQTIQLQDYIFSLKNVNFFNVISISKRAFSAQITRHNIAYI